MNIALLGFDREGKASYNYYSALGHTVTICDQNTAIDIPDGAQQQLGDTYLDNLDRFDLLVRTPGLHPSKILEINPSVADKIWSGTNEFMNVCPTTNIIGVTGTKGKGTTSTLITEMLKAAGKRVHLAGNIGLAALEILPNIQSEDWVILELSNFQLIDLQKSPHIAVCLMVVPEHLDWHLDKDEYYTAKTNIALHQTASDIGIYLPENAISSQIISRSKGSTIPYYAPPGAHVDSEAIVIQGSEVCKTNEIKLLGKHNWQNVCAAVTAAWQVTQDVEALKSVITTFTGMEHRLEFVREYHEIRFYNDSFGTTPETAIVAIEAFSEPKVVIIGGSDKGSDYGQLARTIKEENVRSVVLIGDTADHIRNELSSIGYDRMVDGGSSMTQIVKTAISHAEPGDVVLLSPGCASFGLFANYKDRGNQFRDTVNNL